MSNIDPDKLERALDEAARWERNHPAAVWAPRVLAAARAHLATLPRWKEVEVECWAVVDSDGEAVEAWLVEESARLDAEDTGGTVVRLTGTGKVKVTP